MFTLPTNVSFSLLLGIDFTFFLFLFFGPRLFHNGSLKTFFCRREGSNVGQRVDHGRETRRLDSLGLVDGNRTVSEISPTRRTRQKFVKYRDTPTGTDIVRHETVISR